MGDRIGKPQQGIGWRTDILTISLLKSKCQPKEDKLIANKNLINQ